MLRNNTCLAQEGFVILIWMYIHMHMFIYTTHVINTYNTNIQTYILCFLAQVTITKIVYLSLHISYTYNHGQQIDVYKVFFIIFDSRQFRQHFYTYVLSCLNRIMLSRKHTNTNRLWFIKIDYYTCPPFCETACAIRWTWYHPGMI